MENKQRGRPVNPLKQTLQKNKLILAAQTLLNSKSYSQITIRDIAAEAEINSAMIKYYFGGKEALFVALIEQLADAQLGQFERLQQAEKPLLQFILIIDQVMQAQPGLVHLLHEEVLHKTTPLAYAFMDAFPARVSQFLPALVAKETGIDDPQVAKLAAFNLVSLMLAPLVLKTIRRQAWQIADETVQGSEWAEHLYHSFLNGLRRM